MAKKKIPGNLIGNCGRLAKVWLTQPLPAQSGAEGRKRLWFQSTVPPAKEAATAGKYLPAAAGQIKSLNKRKEI